MRTFVFKKHFTTFSLKSAKSTLSCNDTLNFKTSPVVFMRIFRYCWTLRVISHASITRRGFSKHIFECLSRYACKAYIKLFKFFTLFNATKSESCKHWHSERLTSLIFGALYRKHMVDTGAWIRSNQIIESNFDKVNTESMSRDEIHRLNEANECPELYYNE